MATICAAGPWGRVCRRQRESIEPGPAPRLPDTQSHLSPTPVNSIAENSPQMAPGSQTSTEHTLKTYKHTNLPPAPAATDTIAPERGGYGCHSAGTRRLENTLNRYIAGLL